MIKRFSFYIPILLILCLAAILRFFHFTSLPYTHDELSALSRLHFNGFGELINNGVRPDGHPALIQVFLYYWIKIGGSNEEWVKLPFILTGLLSILLVFNIGNKWLGKNTALFSALFMSLTQYFIIYSQYARPYITGMLFSLMALSAFLEIAFSPAVKKKQYLLFALSLALCAYNHHISALFAALLVLHGFLFIRTKQKIIPYLISCLVSVLLYLPHIGITWGQLKIGGLSEWLAVPKADFLLVFLFFLFHFSFLSLAVAALIVIFSRIAGKQEESSFQNKRKIQMLLFSLFFLSFLIAFFYSILKAPILQYSSLIFSAPCLVLFMFSFLRAFKPLVSYLSLGAMGIVLVFSLQNSRRFFELNHHQGWQEMVLTANHFMKQYPGKKLVSVTRSENFFVDFYKKKYNVPADFVFENTSSLFNAAQITRLIDSCKADILLVSNLEPQQIAQIATVYPILLAKKSGYNFEIFALAKEGVSVSSLFGEPVFISSTDFSSVPGGFNVNAERLISDSLNGGKKFEVKSMDEYTLNFTANYKETAKQEGNHVLAELEIEASDSLEGLLCITVKNDSGNVFFTASEMKGSSKDKDGLIHVYTSMFAGDMAALKNEQLNIFIWNKSRKNFVVRKFSVSIINSNPWKFSLLGSI